MSNWLQMQIRTDELQAEQRKHGHSSGTLAKHPFWKSIL